MTYFTGPGPWPPLPPRSATGRHTPKYLDQFLIFFHATFTTGLICVIQSKRQQPYVLIKTTHTPKYLDQFLAVCMQPSQQDSFL